MKSLVAKSEALILRTFNITTKAQTCEANRKAGEKKRYSSIRASVECSSVSGLIGQAIDPANDYVIHVNAIIVFKSFDLKLC